jgi:hypothetical protein
MACRRANWDWYELCLPLPDAYFPGDLGADPIIPPTDAFTSAELIEVAMFVEGCMPSTYMKYATSDISLLAAMKGRNFDRSLGIYTEMSPYLAVAVAGWAMGANTGLANSAYTLMSKPLTGVLVDDLDENTVDALKKANGNYYVNRGQQFDGFENGVAASGVWFDEIINLDMLSNNIQLSIMDHIRKSKKVAQIEGGVLGIIASFLDDLAKSKRMGFIAPGIWKERPILNLNTGDALENGYLVQSDSVDDQPQAERETRLAPPIYVALKLAGAIHHAVIQLDVNR